MSSIQLLCADPIGTKPRRSLSRAVTVKCLHFRPLNGMGQTGQWDKLIFAFRLTAATAPAARHSTGSAPSRASAPADRVPHGDRGVTSPRLATPVSPAGHQVPHRLPV